MDAKEHHNSSWDLDYHHDFNDSFHWFLHHCTLDLNHDTRRVILFLLYLVIFVAGLIENVLVVCINWRRRSRSTVTFCVLNVGLADLALVLTIPFWMLEVTLNQVWLWGWALCKLTHLVYTVNMYSSVFFLMYMTVERYLAIVKPSQTWGLKEKRKRGIICACLWTFSLFLTLLENIHVDLMEWDEPGCYMFPSYSYNEWYSSITFLSLIFSFLIPAITITIFNFLIARAVKANAGFEGRRSLWVVHVYSLVFMLCWVPRNLVIFLLLVDELWSMPFSCNFVDVLYFSYCIVDCISLFHCVANPIIYNFLSKGFRSNLINTVVRYIPKEIVNPKEKAGSESSTSHSVVVENACNETPPNQEQRAK
ncbi:GP182 protein, partial [Polyodon spathula]|nr:GP182 protein [Polyodon spathula]